jgi:hypothetical protein
MTTTLEVNVENSIKNHIRLIGYEICVMNNIHLSENNHILQNEYVQTIL